MASSTSWLIKHFNQLTTDELYDFLKLRIDVFVVEQTCYYSDLDDLDRHPDTIHLFSYHNEQISSYLRILPAGTSYDEYISIGRVIVDDKQRGSGLGHELISEALKQCVLQFPNKTVKISAQEHLEHFYNKHGFNRVTKMYLEDGIPHIGMIKD